jgi:hypothetical protein
LNQMDTLLRDRIDKMASWSLEKEYENDQKWEI